MAGGQLPAPAPLVWNTDNSSQAPLKLHYGQQSIIRSIVGPLHVLKMRGCGVFILPLPRLECGRDGWTLAATLSHEAAC